MNQRVRKILLPVLLVIFAAVFCYSAYRLIAYYLDNRRQAAITDQAQEYVDTAAPEEQAADGTSDEKVLSVDFDGLRQINSDVKAWIYCPDTKIDYPVVQTGDNEYYLNRQFDRTWNSNGTLFLDCRCTQAFQGGNSIIYGHHMKSGAMFGELSKYKSQAFYEEHPCMYLATTEETYRVELVAGCVVEADADIYQDVTQTPDVSYFTSHSTFTPARETIPTGEWLTLSTCSYEFDDARYVVLGVLVPLADEKHASN